MFGKQVHPSASSELLFNPRVNELGENVDTFQDNLHSVSLLLEEVAELLGSIVNPAELAGEYPRRHNETSLIAQSKFSLYLLQLASLPQLEV